MNKNKNLKFSIIIILLLFSSLLAQTNRQKKSKDYSNHLKKIASSAFRRGNFHVSMNYYQKLYEKEKDSTNYLNFYIKSAINLGEIKRAERYLLKEANIYQMANKNNQKKYDLTAIYKICGYLYLATNREAKADYYLEEIKKRVQNKQQRTLLLAGIYEDAKRYSNAIEEYQNYQKKTNDSLFFADNLYMLYQKEFDNKNSFRYLLLSTIQKMEKNNLDINLLQTQFSKILEIYNNSKPKLQKSIKEKIDQSSLKYPNLNYLLSKIYFQEKNFEQSYAYFKRIEKISSYKKLAYARELFNENIYDKSGEFYQEYFANKNLADYTKNSLFLQDIINYIKCLKYLKKYQDFKQKVKALIKSNKLHSEHELLLLNYMITDFKQIKDAKKIILEKLARNRILNPKNFSLNLVLMKILLIENDFTEYDKLLRKYQTLILKSKNPKLINQFLETEILAAIFKQNYQQFKNKVNSITQKALSDKNMNNYILMKEDLANFQNDTIIFKKLAKVYQEYFNPNSKDTLLSNLVIEKKDLNAYIFLAKNEYFLQKDKLNTMLLQEIVESLLLLKDETISYNEILMDYLTLAAEFKIKLSKSFKEKILKKVLENKNSVYYLKARDIYRKLKEN